MFCNLINPPIGEDLIGWALQPVSARNPPANAQSKSYHQHYPLKSKGLWAKNPIKPSKPPYVCISVKRWPNGPCWSISMALVAVPSCPLPIGKCASKDGQGWQLRRCWEMRNLEFVLVFWSSGGKNCRDRCVFWIDRTILFCSNRVVSKGWKHLTANISGGPRKLMNWRV